MRPYSQNSVQAYNVFAAGALILAGGRFFGYFYVGILDSGP
jgi:hypothetical protein